MVAFGVRPRISGSAFAYPPPPPPARQVRRAAIVAMSQRWMEEQAAAARRRAGAAALIKRLGPTLRAIVVEVATKHGIPVDKMLSRSRQVVLVRARQEAMWLGQGAGLSLNQIGSRLGGYDNSTILSGIRKHAERVAAGMAGQP